MRADMSKHSDSVQLVATKSVTEIVAYLEHPKVIREFHGSTLDGMLEVEFDTDKLKEMIYALDQKQLGKLIEKVGTVCAQWTTLRVAPGNDIGTIARYQEANLIIKHRVTDMPTERPDTKLRPSEAQSNRPQAERREG